jgi:diguanylate cyclase (GGDEF)-like protein
VTLEGGAVDPAARTRSLRREWSRAFTVMLSLLLIAAIATIVGVRGVVDQVQGTARQLTRESVAVSALTKAVVGHEEVAHKLLSAEPVDRSVFIHAQDAITAQFRDAASVFPTRSSMEGTVLQASRQWQNGLMTYGLWSTQLPALHGTHSAQNPTYGASSDAVGALLNGLEGPSLDAMNRGLAHDADLERLLIGILVGLFGLAVAVTVYFRRRMVRDLLRPVATMHAGVSRLQAGEYDHRITIGRRDELGELSEAFNGMAGALRDNHLALTQRATHDSLTGLPNRAALTERLTASFAPGSERRARQESVLFIDVDDFKEVNDKLGHEGGDELLTQLGARLKNCVREHDLVARLGGDEFAIVVVEDDVATAGQVAERILDALRTPFIVNNTNLNVSVSIGVALRRPETTDAAELLRSADFAMYMAKGDGKDRYQTFDAQIHDDLAARSALKNDLAVAASAGQLRLEYQPVVDLHTGAVLGVEALVRWQHPTLGLLPPADFITLAEDSGDIAAIGCWVLRTAVRQATVWRQSIEQCSDLWVAVNLSPFQLPNSQNMTALRRILTDPAAQAEHVVLELTETALASDPDGGATALKKLKELGVRIAIDDFGTGYSSLSTLANLPIDILKIDQSFVSGHAANSACIAMLEGILGLADKLSLTVIAEGIEDPEQLDLLRHLGCAVGQGYLLGRPIPAADLHALLANRTLPHLTSALATTAPQ